MPTYLMLLIASVIDRSCSAEEWHDELEPQHCVFLLDARDEQGDLIYVAIIRTRLFWFVIVELLLISATEAICFCRLGIMGQFLWSLLLTVNWLALKHSFMCLQVHSTAENWADLPDLQHRKHRGGEVEKEERYRRRRGTEGVWGIVAPQTSSVLHWGLWGRAWQHLHGLNHRPTNPLAHQGNPW